VYQIALRVIRDLFACDQTDVVSSVVFNGFVRSSDHGTGQEASACIISIQTSRLAFEAINLVNIEPKACCRQLKAIGSSKLYGITPIAPIMDLTRSDRRFVSPYGVVDQLHEGVNLAAMDWEDFEHLIREIFEKEFSSVGGEVKVTQASRDRGVDAVIFDPDPIRGGKIVVQAKRYAHTVDVSAVRDLYGTVMNEGAMKGILVTSSNYGPDAYEFAKDKPITLLSGANLLHLLQKHGVKAHIDLAEARSRERDSVGSPTIKV
jgi:restriction system protein